MEIDIYSLPAMASEPERVFFEAKQATSDQRNNLKEETIELLEWSKSWFRLGIFTAGDLHSIVKGGENEVKEALD